MNSEIETTMKFLDRLQVDTIEEVKYEGDVLGPHKCVCGQPIKRGHLCVNTRNHRECVVGKNCLRYVKNYLCLR